MCICLSVNACMCVCVCVCVCVCMCVCVCLCVCVCVYVWAVSAFPSELWIPLGRAMADDHESSAWSSRPWWITLLGNSVVTSQPVTWRTLLKVQSYCPPWARVWDVWFVKGHSLTHTDDLAFLTVSWSYSFSNFGETFAVNFVITCKYIQVGSVLEYDRHWSVISYPGA